MDDGDLPFYLMFIFFEENYLGRHNYSLLLRNSSWNLRQCQSKHQVRRHNRDIFLIFFNIKVCCVFLLESPHQGNSNEYTQYTIFNIKKKITLNYPNVAMGFLPWTLKNEF